MEALDPTRWAVLSPKIDELLALPSEQRSRRLDDIAVHDPVSAGDLRALLLARDDASRVNFLSASAVSAWRPVGATAGDALGAWTLVEAIGEGGMGSVWRARRSDGRFEGEAAVKLLRSGLFDSATQERFRREGAILARLRHPGIAQLLDAGITPQGQPYLVLELVHGEQVDRWCDARALGVRQRVELFLQVLEAVSAAHGQLVIHRDLKPSNLLVDDSGRVKLLDFGIARLLPEHDTPDQTALTLDGAVALTPAFAAPEQFRHAVLSMATDVFALGVALYTLLAGAHPSGLPAGSAAPDYMKAATEGRHVAASSAAPARRRELRGDLDTILAKACAAEPQARYASALALSDDLQRHLRNEPIVARAPTLTYRLGKLLRRRPLEAALLAAIVLAVPAGAHVQAAVLLSFGIGTGAALWQMGRARRQAAHARTEQRRAESVKEFIASTFSQAVPREGTGGVVAAADLLRSAHARVRTELRGQPLVAAELLAIIGDSFHQLGDVSAARAVLTEAAERCEQVFGRTHPLTMHTRTGLAHARVVQGELDAVEHMLPVLLSDLRSAMPASAADLVSALQHHSYALTKRGDAEAAIQALKDASAIAREHLSTTHRQTLSTLSLLGNTLATFGRDAEAIAVLQPAVDALREAPGTQRPNTDLARLESFLASSMIAIGRLGEAEHLLRQVLSDQLALDGCDTIRNRYTRNMLALVRAQRGDLVEAIELQQQTLAAEARLAPTPTVDTGTMTAQLGEMLVEAGRFESGLAAIERAEAIVRDAGGAGQAYPALRRQVRRAHALLVAGQPGEALACATTVFDRAQTVEGWIAAVALRVRLDALRELSRLDEAEEQLSSLLTLTSAPQITSLNRARALLAAAALRVAQGRAVDGAVFAEEALTLLAASQVPESALLKRAREMLQRCSEVAPSVGSSGTHPRS
jgi:tetratricopeptide (TPR) repeat protein